MSGGRECVCVCACVCARVCIYTVAQTVDRLVNDAPKGRLESRGEGGREEEGGERQTDAAGVERRGLHGRSLRPEHSAARPRGFPQYTRVRACNQLISPPRRRPSPFFPSSLSLPPSKD